MIRLSAGVSQPLRSGSGFVLVTLTIRTAQKRGYLLSRVNGVNLDQSIRERGEAREKVEIDKNKNRLVLGFLGNTRGISTDQHTKTALTVSFGQHYR